MQDNPLLDLSGLPKFDAILPQHVEPAVDSILGHNREKINSLIETVDEPGWDNFMAPLEALDDELERVWAPVSHLNGVRDSDELREAYEACLPKLSDYTSELGQDKRLFDKVLAVKESEAFGRLDSEQKKVIDNALRDFRLSGIDLSSDKQERFREIASELSRLCNLFSQNVMDATDAWHIDITEEAKVSGIPDSGLGLAAQTAKAADAEGWRFTLQGPSYIAVMTYADNAKLRESVYRAYISRASDVGPNAGEWDNSEVMCEILALRQEEAALLGFANYASLSVETKMAENPEQVSRFLRELSGKSRPAALREVEELLAFSAEHLGMDSLNPWDYAYVSEKLQQHRYAFSQEALRPYFPLPQVQDGMFKIVGKLFGISVEPAEAPSVWHEDVQFFRIIDETDAVRGYFYVDLYARKQKRGGAWMADCVGRRKTTDGMQLPVAFLTCNFSAPVGATPSLLTHDEMMTLFHEFGHGLHHMLTKVETAGVAGINGVPWDAVELPSQFLENWCWEAEALDLVSGHVDTGEALPEDLLEKMKKARNFQSAMQMCRQLEFSLFDMRIHGDFVAKSAADIQQVLNQVREEVAVIDAPVYNRFQHGFGHIFAGGYAAGYYSYKWAEVLSADAYSLFEENGVFDGKTGRQFLELILEKGGAEEPMTLFVAFRGRKPSVEALLRHSGLSQLENAA